MRYSSRTLARIGAIQVIYQIEQDPSISLEVAMDSFDQPIFEEDAKYPPMQRSLFETLVNGVHGQRQKLDSLLENIIDQKRPWSRMSVMMRSVLLPSLYELSDEIKTAESIIISEYVGITHLFFHGRESTFIHGILAQASEKIRNT